MAEMQDSRPKKYDIIVWGATGVVGRLVSEHLTRDYQRKAVKWAIAGRNGTKLETVRRDLAAIDPSIGDLPIITASLQDAASLEAMTAQAKVVLATAGPYARYGTPLVEACINTGTSYCDVTGETAWVRRIIKTYEGRAREKGVKIITMAGFDSIPSDLAAFTLAQHIKEKYGRGTKKVEILYTGVDGPVSGGSIASLLGLFFEEKGDGRKAVTDPYGLDPPTSSRGPDKAESLLPGYSKLQHSYHAPFMMAPINTRIVRRSNALLGHRYGKDFSYSEHQRAANFPAAAFGALVPFLIAVLCAFSFIRAWLQKVLPQPGHMPERKLLLKYYWSGTAVAVSEGDRPEIAKMELKGFGDAGFWTTSRMLLEAGLCIALQDKELKEAGMLPSGILTPASALGSVLLNRLNNVPSFFSFRIVT